MDWKALIFSVIGVIILTILLIYFNVLPASAVPVQNFCISDRNCVLSLCDCECHNPGQTPEELRDIVCGKNCAAWYNVSGCKCSFFECVEITT